MVADLEQGDVEVKYTRPVLTKANNTCVSVLAIEGQGRCGHLGDKQFDIFDPAIQILTSANYAEQKLLDADQAKEKLACFCFQTDARSALRIIYSKTLEYSNDINHPFVNWARVSCLDGFNFWLKKDTCPATGKPYGLDQNATEMVRSGSADLVLMETPDAEIRIARPVLEDVNEKMVACDRQKRALELYNFSPSLTWDRRLTSSFGTIPEDITL